MHDFVELVLIDLRAMLGGGVERVADFRAWAFG